MENHKKHRTQSTLEEHKDLRLFQAVLKGKQGHILVEFLEMLNLSKKH